MKVELHNNGELVESRNMLGTLEFAPKGLMPTRIGMLNLQTLMIVYHVPYKLELIEFEPIVKGHRSYMVCRYAFYYEECLAELLIPLIAI
jgi:hypothetical protein